MQNPSGKNIDLIDEERVPRFVVGLGASAGGLESLEKLFPNLSPDTGMAFVVLQHLSPDFKSMMYELLGRDTAMEIHRAEDGMKVQANSVYLLPPRKEMTIQNGHLRVAEREPSKGLSLPIDLFLESLALDQSTQAIAVILSGSGSDGSRGILEIARNGGFVISESLKTAKFDGMPASAAQTGVVDEVLPPEEIGALLLRIATEPEVTRTARIAAVASRQHRLEGMESIYHRFRETYDIDFEVYKDTTVHRRVHRRMTLLGIDSVDGYANRLGDDPDELEALYCDLLIGVTQFFRDPDTFDLLSKTVFPDLVHNRDDNHPLRVWVAGCATGEEAYSMAIAIYEAFEQVGQRPTLKLFATDVHKSSIEHAGRGIYRSDVFKGVDEERLQRYFTRRENGYQILPEIRKSIVFAPHNVLNDAPFTDIDLVSCRNLLIYFQGVAQTRALSMFHYALRKSGILLLGGSESPGDLSGEFDVVYERERVYRKRRQVRLPNEFRAPLKRPAGNRLHSAAVRIAPAHQSSRNVDPSLHDQLLNRFMPPSLLVDENRYLIESFGGAERFLRLRARQPSLDVLDLMDDSLRTTLSGAIGRTLKDNQPVRFSNVRLRVDDSEQTFNLCVTPVIHSSVSGRHYVIAFEELSVSSRVAPEDPLIHEVDASRDHIHRLEDDLRYTRENLQATIEELETSNEELQATNEELIASNEELQSTNEELHSVNEELYTVNAEHQRKITELAELNQDMNHLLENTDVATVFLDKDLRVRRFTSRVTRLFDLVMHDIGRPIHSFLPRFACNQLSERLQTVLTTNQSQEQEIVTTDGTCYLMRMLPYRIEQSVEGVVLMFIDVSSLEVLRERLRWMSAIVESTDDAIIGQDLDGKITSWNAGAERLYQFTAEEAIGQDIAMLIPEHRREEVLEYRDTISAGDRLRTRDTLRIRKDGSIIHVSLTVSPVFDMNDRLIGISKIARDVSHRVAMEQEIQHQVSQREAFLATLSHELRNPLAAALSASRLIEDERTDDATRREAAKIVGRQILMTRGLLSDLLDMSRITQGKVKLQREIVDLCGLVQAVRETTLSEATTHHQEITWDIPEQPVYVSGDPTRLTQVQVNLIHNALKYSPVHTEVRVRISQSDSEAMIEVTDYGVGIPADQLELIFDPFVQLGETVHQSEGGLGVGLTLVRCLVDAHGGRVKAESQGAGLGTTFRVWLPILNIKDSQAQRPQAPKISTSNIARTIVLIEDIADSRRMLAALLKLEGHAVHVCEDGESGVHAIEQHVPDFALVDIGLPGIDGYEVARRIRANDRCNQTRLIALTGFGQESDVKFALSVGFDSHLVKPVDLESLTELMQRFSTP